jgi:hypothetical protein
MIMLNRQTVRRAAMAAVAAITLGVAIVGTTEPAAAWWHGGWGWHHGWGWGGWHAGFWGYGPGWGYGWRACPPGMHLGPYGHHCWPN